MVQLTLRTYRLDTRTKGRRGKFHSQRTEMFKNLLYRTNFSLKRQKSDNLVEGSRLQQEDSIEKPHNVL